MANSMGSIDETVLFVLWMSFLAIWCIVTILIGVHCVLWWKVSEAATSSLDNRRHFITPLSATGFCCNHAESNFSTTTTNQATHFDFKNNNNTKKILTKRDERMCEQLSEHEHEQIANQTRLLARKLIDKLTVATSPYSDSHVNKTRSCRVS